MTGRIKSKWVNAFKNVKGSQQSNNQAPAAGGGKAPKAVSGMVTCGWLKYKVVSCVLPSFSARFHLYLDSNYIGCPIGEL